ncbi:MAG: DNA-processing protein DprA [Pseudomonadales bacterium]|nr:DNA-processing protein DprA [Pseudomonadales bacterium]
MLNDSDLPYWLALWRVPQVGPGLFKQLLQHCGDISRCFHMSADELLKLGLSEHQIAAIHGFQMGVDPLLSKGVDADLAWLQEENSHVITFEDPLYPALLKTIPSAPPLLFVKGDVGLLNWPQIAIVGSRQPTRQGLQNAKDFAKHFVREGFAVTSGLAMGVDAAAHMGAIAGNGPTIGVTAHGLDKIFPKRNRPLAAEMLNKGAWVSEFPVGVVPRPNYFPRRNRIISGLSLGVLVVEAAVKSGSLITARQAIQQNREVFAIPGSIHNPLAKGCHLMIREGAKLVEQAQDITEELLPLLSYQQKQLNLSLESVETVQLKVHSAPGYGKKTSEYQVLNVLDQDPMLVDEIVVRTGMSVADVNAALVMLEIDGAINNQQGGYTLARAS